MSATVLRDSLRDSLNKQIEAHAAYVIERTGDTLDQIRLHQGRVAGLRLAADLLDQHYRDLH